MRRKYEDGRQRGIVRKPPELKKAGGTPLREKNTNTITAHAERATLVKANSNILRPSAVHWIHTQKMWQWWRAEKNTPYTYKWKSENARKKR